MKVVQFMASSGYGGAEKVFIELSNALADKHQVSTLIIRSCSFKHRFSPAVQVVELKSNPTGNNPLLHFEIMRKLQAIQPDLVHTHAAKATELVYRVNRILGLKQLGTKHNDRKGHVFNRLDWVSTVSLKALRSIQGKSSARVRVIYNSVIEEAVDDRPKSKTFTILAVGRLDKIKGFDILIKQVTHLDFPFRLHIVGEGPEQSRLANLIRKYHLTAQVELTGFHDNVAQMMHDSDLVVISSHKEGGPKVMLEALLYAPVLVSTAVGAVPEFLPESLITSHEELSAKINEVYGNYPIFSQICRTVRDQKKHLFTFKTIVKQYEELYTEMTGIACPD